MLPEKNRLCGTGAWQGCGAAFCWKWGYADLVCVGDTNCTAFCYPPTYWDTLPMPEDFESRSQKLQIYYSVPSPAIFVECNKKKLWKLLFEIRTYFYGGWAKVNWNNSHYQRTPKLFGNIIRTGSVLNGNHELVFGQETQQLRWI